MSFRFVAGTRTHPRRRSTRKPESLQKRGKSSASSFYSLYSIVHNPSISFSIKTPLRRGFYTPFIAAGECLYRSQRGGKPIERKGRKSVCRRLLDSSSE